MIRLITAGEWYKCEDTVQIICWAEDWDTMAELERQKKESLRAGEWDRYKDTKRNWKWRLRQVERNKTNCVDQESETGTNMS